MCCGENDNGPNAIMSEAELHTRGAKRGKKKKGKSPKFKSPKFKFSRDFLHGSLEGMT